jgi:hypothetical protein
MSGVRGPNISKAMRATIFRAAWENPKKDRRILAAELFEKLEGRSPSVETIEKMISAARNQPDPLDGPWSIGSVKDHPVPPDALPILMEVYYRRLHEEGALIKHTVDSGGNYLDVVYDKVLSIRVALWIGRLYIIVQNLTIMEEMAEAYALEERVEEILDRAPCSTEIDLLLLESTKKLNSGQLPSAWSIFMLVSAKRRELEQMRRKQDRKKKGTKEDK